MPETVSHLYRRINDRLSFCFNIETTGPLTAEEARCLRLILADGFRADTITDAPQDSGQTVVEIGPRLNFATAWSTNILAICRSVGLDMVSRVERSRRYVDMVDLLLANVCKQNVTRLPYEITRLAEDIAGGLMVTMPAESDFKSDLKVTKDGQTIGDM